MKPHWTARFIHFRFVAFLFILGVLAWQLFPRAVDEPTLQPAEVEQQRLAIFNSLKIWNALKEFQTRQGTDTAPYPSDIHQLDEMGITHDIRSLLTLKPQFAGDWLYFSAADSEDPAAPLLVSPRLAAQDRSPALPQQLVMTVSGAIQIKTPLEAQKLIDASPTPPVRFAAPLAP